MAVLRFLASLFALVAVVALVVDATPAVNGTGPFVATSVAGRWHELAPASLQAARASVVHATAPWVWDNVLMGVMNQPTFALFGGLALVAGYFGRRRYKMQVYIN